MKYQIWLKRFSVKSQGYADPEVIITRYKVYPNAFVEEIVARLLSKIFNPKYNMESDLDKMTPKIVNSINNHFKKAKIFILHDDQEQPFPHYRYRHHG